jgi:hypothetical protein
VGVRPGQVRAASTEPASHLPVAYRQHGLPVSLVRMDGIRNGVDKPVT